MTNASKIVVQTYVTLAFFYLVFAALCVAQRYYTPAPNPIAVKPMGENEIKEEFKREQSQKRVERATRQADTIYRHHGCSSEYSAFTGQAALDFGLSPRLLAALVVVESSCNPRAQDGVGSFGLTQVNGRTWHVSRRALVNPRINIRIGAMILASYVRRFGLVEGLHHYNGYSEVHDHTYVKKVLTTAGMSDRLPA